MLIHTGLSPSYFPVLPSQLPLHRVPTNGYLSTSPSHLPMHPYCPRPASLSALPTRLFLYLSTFCVLQPFYPVPFVSFSFPSPTSPSPPLCDYVRHNSSQTHHSDSSAWVTLCHGLKSSMTSHTSLSHMKLIWVWRGERQTSCTTATEVRNIVCPCSPEGKQHTGWSLEAVGYEMYLFFAFHITNKRAKSFLPNIHIDVLLSSLNRITVYMLPAASHKNEKNYYLHHNNICIHPIIYVYIDTSIKRIALTHRLYRKKHMSRTAHRCCFPFACLFLSCVFWERESYSSRYKHTEQEKERGKKRGERREIWIMWVRGERREERD